MTTTPVLRGGPASLPGHPHLRERSTWAAALVLLATATAAQVAAGGAPIGAAVVATVWLAGGRWMWRLRLADGAVVPSRHTNQAVAIIALFHVVSVGVIGLFGGLSASPTVPDFGSLSLVVVTVAKVAGVEMLRAALLPNDANRRWTAAALSVTGFAWVAAVPAGTWWAIGRNVHAVQLIAGVAIPMLAMSALYTRLTMRWGMGTSVTYATTMATIIALLGVGSPSDWSIAMATGVMIPTVAWLLAEHVLNDLPRPKRWVTPHSRPVLRTWHIATVTVAALALIGSAIAGIRPAVVSGSSMIPTFHPGDLLLVGRPTSQVSPGDIVLHSAGDLTVVHRVIRVEGETVTTRGDNLAFDDEGVAIGDLDGIVLLRIPGLGMPALLLGG